MPDTTPEQAVIQAALLPCPFCGGEGSHRYDYPRGTSIKHHFVLCAENGHHMGGLGCYNGAPGRAQPSASRGSCDKCQRENIPCIFATKAWNTRLAHSQPASEGLREDQPDIPRDIAEPVALWPVGTLVRKRSGGQWHGRVCGYYTTDLTAEGYAVESLREPGSVQIYPRKALELWEGDALPLLGAEEREERA